MSIGPSLLSYYTLLSINPLVLLGDDESILVIDWKTVAYNANEKTSGDIVIRRITIALREQGQPSIEVIKRPDLQVPRGAVVYFGKAHGVI